MKNKKFLGILCGLVTLVALPFAFLGNDNVKAADAAGEVTLGAATIEPEILFGNGKTDNVAIKSLTTNGSNYGAITKGTDYFTGYKRSGNDSTQRTFRGRRDSISYNALFEQGAFIEFTLNVSYPNRYKTVDIYYAAKYDTGACCYVEAGNLKRITLATTDSTSAFRTLKLTPNVAGIQSNPKIRFYVEGIDGANIAVFIKSITFNHCAPTDFASEFNACMNQYCDLTGNTSAQNLANIASAWKGYLADDFSRMTDANQADIRNTIANPNPADNKGHCVWIYDYIFGKYSVALGLNDFIGRNPSVRSSLSYFSLFNDMSDGNNAVTISLIIAGISLIGIASYVVIKKRKENI